MTVVTVMQPTYWSRTHVWNRALSSDVFIWLDHVQFSRSSTKWEDRTIVEQPDGRPTVLRLPLRGSRNRPWSETTVNDGWRKHDKTIRHCYGSAPGWGAIEADIAEVYASDAATIEDVCWRSFSAVKRLLDAKFVLVRSSDLQPTRAKGDLVLELVQAVNGSTYICGEPGLTYLPLSAFKAARIEVAPQRWTAPSTSRGLSNPSVLHLLAHAGDATCVYSTLQSNSHTPR